MLFTNGNLFNPEEDKAEIGVITTLIISSGNNPYLPLPAYF
jgi:hypothetical protein